MIEASPGRRALPMWLAITAVIALAANLRVAVSSVGALLPDIRDANSLGGFGTGLLTALPPFCFGVMGLAGPTVARRIGLHRTALLSLVLITAGQVIRAVVPGALWLFTGSVITLAAIALGNVIMPSILREMFPGRIASMTAAYTMVMATMQASVSFVTIPLTNALGGDWRLGIGMWAVLALMAMIPWLPMARRQTAPAEAGAHRLPLATIARVPKGWALALFFGIQSLNAYFSFGWYPTLLRDQGLSQQFAAAQVGFVSIAATVASIFAPGLLGRMRRPALLTWVLFACNIVAYLGLWLAPTTATTLWSIILGTGQTYFTIALYVVNLRADTTTGVLSLSGFMQSVGYLVAGSGLLLLGTVHGGSTEWGGVIIVMMMLSAFLQLFALVGVGRWSIEKELAARQLLPDELQPAEPA